MDISNSVNRVRDFFHTGKTRDISFRLQSLKALKQAILGNETLIVDALKADLNKSASETYMCEIGMIYDEINFHMKHLRSWAKNKRVKTPLSQFKSVSFVSPEPYGVVLIMSPWNYPLQLCLCPLVGVISSGNCAIIKPSAYAKNTSSAVAKIIKDTFPDDYITVIEGGRAQNSALLSERFDYIFFTGSVNVGKVVMEAASKHLTPVSLELGGKSPVIVDKTADLKTAARRIAFGKVLNAGQTCVAPDYLLIQKDVKERFIGYYKDALDAFFPNGRYSDYPRIINEKHFDRLISLFKNEKAVIGGSFEKEKLFIEPTLLDSVKLDSPIMGEEIFGPILPMIEFETLSDCVDIINSKPKPLALYLFTRDKESERHVLSHCSFGGGRINDTIIHLATPHMGFGGVGNSGMGAYHGKKSFDTFTHYRSIVKKSNKPDLKMRYRPYSGKKDKVIRKFMK